MKAIINGLRYDTEKATKIGEYSHGAYPQSGDFSHWSAALYVTKRGSYFLSGEGGAMTQFSESSPYGGSSGGSKLIPLEPEEALYWAEHHLDTETVEQFFGSEIENA